MFREKYMLLIYIFEPVPRALVLVPIITVSSTLAPAQIKRKNAGHINCVQADSLSPVSV